MSLDKYEVANAYVEYLQGEGEHLLSLVADDFWDNVSRQRGPDIWRLVATWLSSTFADVAVDLHSVAQDDDSRVLVWVTLHGTHIGSAFPFLRERAPTGRRVAWSQVHVFRVEADAIVEHWAVRGDLQLLEAIEFVA